MEEFLVKSDMWVQHKNEHFILITADYLDEIYIVNKASNLEDGGILVQGFKNYVGVPDWEFIEDIKVHFFKSKEEYENFKNSILKSLK